MSHLPLFFDVGGRKVVVVGEGAAADSRAGLARAAGAVVSRGMDFAGAVAAFVATGVEASDRAAAGAARAAGVPVNVMDRPALCDFIMPAIVRRGDVTVAVSTGGVSPTLAQIVRGRIEAALPERLGELATLAAQFRAQVNRLVPEMPRRRALWRRVLGQTGPEEARRSILKELDSARSDTAPLGIAHIVGAGPGDPDLLTLRAAQLLQEADAILHDDLVPPAILARARREAELVSVGKRKGRHSWRQQDIETELVRRVRAGQIVVRLKAGDPFIFGRGGEEVEALRAAGLPFTVVPGITAALGCAASAGIPLTHRKLASSVTFLTGHAAEDGGQDSGKGETHVVYMGASEAGAVRDRLLAQGLDSATPVAIVENGTRPDQRVTTGALADLARLAVGHSARADAGPSLIVIGAVAALAQTGANAENEAILAEAS